MELNNVNLLELLNDTQALYSTNFFGEFEVPADLLELILENFQFNKPIFNGILFLQKHPTENQSYIVVDGMKRLLTLSLLLYSICECFKNTSKKNELAIKLIKQRYLFNENKPKIQLFGYEKQIYEKLITHQEMDNEEKNHPMFKILHEFWAKIKMNNLVASKLFNTIKRLTGLVCVYEKCKFDNRELYQSLNCNNQNIGELLLINDFIKDNANSKEEVDAWFNIVEMFKEADMTRKIRYFLCDYLTIQRNGIIPKLNELYTSFKNYYKKMIKSGIKPEAIFKIIETSAKYYIKISTANFENPTIKDKIMTIKENNMYETFPYLLEVMEDYESDRITTETFSEILNNLILFIAEQRSGNFESIINFAGLSQEINRRIK